MAERVFFRIGLTCSCIARLLPVVEEYMIWNGLIKESLDLFQLGYRTDVEASRGSHGRGSAVDGGQTSDEQIDVLRQFGITAQRRNLTNPDGSKIVEHWHGWAYRCPHKSPALAAQERDWDNRDAGLVGNARVQGRWPIDPWDVSLARMEKKMAKTLDDIKAEIIAELRQSIADIPRRVWGVDGVIDNQFTGNTANKEVAGGSALIAIDNKVDKVLAAVRQPAPTPAPKEPTT